MPALADLYRELHLDGSRDSPSVHQNLRNAFRVVARNRDHHLLVAELDGKVVGTLHVLIFRHLGHEARPSAVVENVVVAGGMRSKGIGERMLAAAQAIAERERCYKLSLTSNIQRRRAHRFYRRLGWRRSHFGFSFDLE